MVDYKKFLDLNVQVLGISANIAFSQKTFAASLGLPFPLLSDHPHLKTIRAYGIQQELGDTGRMHALQAWFLVDKQGIVRGRWVVDNKTVLSNDEIFEAVKALGR